MHSLTWFFQLKPCRPGPERRKFPFIALGQCRLLCRKKRRGELKGSQAANTGPRFHAGSRNPHSWAGTLPNIFLPWERGPRYYLLSTATSKLLVISKIRRNTHLSLLDHQPTSPLQEQAPPPPPPDMSVRAQPQPPQLKGSGWNLQRELNHLLL